MSDNSDNKELVGPLNKVSNELVDIGPRIIMAGNEVLGTADNISILVDEVAGEELDKIKSANEIRLVKWLG